MYSLLRFGVFWKNIGMSQSDGFSELAKLLGADKPLDADKLLDADKSSGFGCCSKNNMSSICGDFVVVGELLVRKEISVRIAVLEVVNCS